MIVGAAALELHVHGSRSLKQKRGVVRSISQRLRNRFNISVAEVGGQDTWQRAVLGLTAAGAEAPVVRRVLEQALEYAEGLHLAEVTFSDVEILELPWQEDGDEAQEDEDSGEAST
ncbi:MAG: DUF503 domain-containing protein [Myxococcota bacterium]|nr:DUF503 domain-containing protein [Myxococcota bacterium]